MLAGRAQHDHAHARILIEGLEHKAKLIALVHFDDVERRPIKHNVGAFARAVDLDAKTVELCQPWIGEGRRRGFVHAAVPCRRGAAADSGV